MKKFARLPKSFSYVFFQIQISYS